MMASGSNLVKRNVNKQIIEWGSECLETRGYTLVNHQPEIIQDTPWSCVVRFTTTVGFIYLKQTPKQLALEASITQILYEQFKAPVPNVIAQNKDLNCFLMIDAGKPLREILKKNFDTQFLCMAVDQFTRLQITLSEELFIFSDLGVPDWQLDKLADLYDRLLSQRAILIADGLTETEINTLKALVPKVAGLCNKLSSFPIKPSIVQCDFHDNNILVDELSQKITFIDLGEVVISHPFFSLVGFMRQMEFHHALSFTEVDYLKLMDVCFKNYVAFESKINLLAILEMTKILWHVYEALAQHRLMLACDKARFKSYQRHGKLRHRLRDFIHASHGISND